MYQGHAQAIPMTGSSLALDTWMTAVCQELNTLWQHGTGVLNGNNCTPYPGYVL